MCTPCMFNGILFLVGIIAAILGLFTGNLNVV